MQVAASDEAARWENIVGLAHAIAVRTDHLFQQLMAEENHLKEVQITGILCSNRTYDVARVTFLGMTTSPLSRGALDAEQRAANATTRAEAAARRAEASVDRVDHAVLRLESSTNTAEGQFNTHLRK